MKLRPDLLDADSPKGIEVFQLTTETDVPGSHIYMEAQIFTSDSRRFVLHRAATAHCGIQGDTRHQYLLCDLADNGSLHPLTHEAGVTAPAVSPDDKGLYYFVDETVPGGGRLLLKRVNLDGADRRTILALDTPLPGVKFRCSRIYPLSTISSDGKRLAVAAFLGDGTTEDAPWGLMVFNLEKAAVNLALHGQTWCNIHPQYCRSCDAAEARDIMVQENHDNVADAQGTITRLVGGDGADIHLVRDDGSDFRNLPWGRDGNEFCQGHQCWRGRSACAITSTSTRKPAEAQLIQGRGVPHAGHVGLRSPGGRRVDLSAGFRSPQFHHFATDIAGKRLITDSKPFDRGGRIYAAEFGRGGEAALENWRYLLTPRSTCRKDTHIHPFLSPDGTTGFFNSDESGLLQAYMVRGL